MFIYVSWIPAFAGMTIIGDRGRALIRLVLPSILLDTFCEFVSALATADKGMQQSPGMFATYLQRNRHRSHL
jgi:hypothetical protein